MQQPKLTARRWRGHGPTVAAAGEARRVELISLVAQRSARPAAIRRAAATSVKAHGLEHHLAKVAARFQKDRAR